MARIFRPCRTADIARPEEHGRMPTLSVVDLELHAQKVSLVLTVGSAGRLSYGVGTIGDCILRSEFHLRIELPLQPEFKFLDIAVGGVPFGFVT